MFLQDLHESLATELLVKGNKVGTTQVRRLARLDGLAVAIAHIKFAVRVAQLIEGGTSIVHNLVFVPKGFDATVLFGYTEIAVCPLLFRYADGRLIVAHIVTSFNHISTSPSL